MPAAPHPDGGADQGQNGPSLGDVFPYSAPYDAQADAIERLAELYRDRGIAVLEGACGTGKTLAALTPALQAVRDEGTRFERVMVITSVKQQLRAFEEDGKAINANLPEQQSPIKGLSLVGKEDLCPYASQGRTDSREFYSECETLRDPVRQAGASAPGPQEKIGMWDRMASEAFGADRMLEGEGWEAPYQPEIPEDDDTDEQYCPFYAAFRSTAQKDEEGYHPRGIMTPPEMLAFGAEEGLCPHALMRSGIQNAELVIANYYHVFDPVTVERLTGELIGPETILIVDEAHGVEESVRELLSEDLSRYSIERAIDEIDTVLDADGDFGRHARRALDETGIGERRVDMFAGFLQEVLRWIDGQAVDALEAHDPEWLDDLTDLPDEIEINLREPDTPEPDTFTEWVEAQGHMEDWADAKAVGEAVADALQEAAKEMGNSRDKTFADSVGRILERWRSCGHDQYFRQFVLEARDGLWGDKDGWKQAYRAQLTMKNCIPSEPIAHRIGEFGAATLMSATLAPVDVFREVVGVEELAEEGRPVEEMVYGLGFPEENRRSIAVKTSPFTGTNRGNPEWEEYWDDETESVREEYADVIRDVARTTPGNVLVCMPSYAEAEWAGDVLEEAVDVEKTVLVDESSSETATKQLKAEFFDGEGKVLCTGLRGTLTEGVDYDGDRLAAAVVCGVPIRGLGGDYPDAIETAYERRFGQSNGFEYAFTVPAVRKARQAIGRVIRGADEVGIRVIADDRYVDEHRWNSVREYLPEYAIEDFESAAPEYLGPALENFWSGVDGTTE